MAHMLGIKKENVHAIISHISRCRETGDNVDQELSRLNEYHTKYPNKDLYTIYKEEIADCKVQNRKDVNVLASWVITLPKDIEPGSAEEEMFFDATRKFLQERYPNTYIGDSIHRDEPKSRPHMHYLLIPKVKEIKAEKIRDPETGKLKKTGRKIETGRYKIALNDLVKRTDMIRFHDDLSDKIKQVLGREVLILTGTTKENGGNMNLNQYRAEMERRNAIKAQAEAETAKEALNKEKSEIEKKQAQLRQKEAQLQQRLKAAAEAQAKANEKASKAEQAQRVADDTLASVNEAKITAQKEAAKIISDAKNEAEQTRRAADAALATAEEKTKDVQNREKIISEREAALEETRPDIKAARLGREIKELETQLQSPDLKPTTMEEMADIAKSTADSRYATLAKQLKDLKIAEKQGFKDMQRTHEINRVQSEMTNIFNIYFDDGQRAVANAKYKELQIAEHEKDQKRQELTEKLVIKRREYEYNNSGAAAWLMENSCEWPLVAQKIEEFRREKQAVSEQEKPRQTEVKPMPKVKERREFER